MTFQLQVNFVNIYVLYSKDSSQRGCLLCDQNSERDTLEL